MCEGWVRIVKARKISLSELVIAVQSVLIVVLAISLYSEYSHNQYFQVYFSDFWSSNYQRILLGMILAITILVIVDGLWPIVRRHEAKNTEP